MAASENSESSRWFHNLRSFKIDVGLKEGDVLAFDRGYFKHYVVLERKLNKREDSDYDCIHLTDCGLCCSRKCSDPIELVFGDEISCEKVKLIKLSEVHDGSNVRLDNQYPLMKGWKERFRDFSLKRMLPGKDHVLVNCESFANYIRSGSDTLPLQRFAVKQKIDQSVQVSGSDCTKNGINCYACGMEIELVKNELITSMVPCSNCNEKMVSKVIDLWIDFIPSQLLTDHRTTARTLQIYSLSVQQFTGISQLRFT